MFAKCIDVIIMMVIINYTGVVGLIKLMQILPASSCQQYKDNDIWYMGIRK